MYVCVLVYLPCLLRTNKKSYNFVSFANIQLKFGVIVAENPPQQSEILRR